MFEPFLPADLPGPGDDEHPNEEQRADPAERGAADAEMMMTHGAPDRGDAVAAPDDSDSSASYEMRPAAADPAWGAHPHQTGDSSTGGPEGDHAFDDAADDDGDDDVDADADDIDWGTDEDDGDAYADDDEDDIDDDEVNGAIAARGDRRPGTDRPGQRHGDDDHEIIEQEQLQVGKLRERAILVACLLPESTYDERDPLGELKSLADTAGAVVVGEMIQRRRKPDVATYLGAGKVEDLKVMKEELQAKLIVFDNELSPSQIRNIEKIVQCKILDRSELILDIFAGRATTKAAKLQVELAQLEYTYPRLRAMWSHLGQITGGAPVGIGTRGPGETQIEIDRRIVQRRKAILRERLAEIDARRRREVEKRAAENFTTCFVGYTNAGKSTLFNALTEPSGGGGAYADNRLFATLTTRTRAWPLGGGDSAMLSDTVGFVRDLPHHLIASFKATLEEALHADLLLIVIDVADPMAEHHYDVVMRTLDQLVEENVEEEPQWRRPSSVTHDRDDHDDADEDGETPTSRGDRGGRGGNGRGDGGRIENGRRPAATPGARRSSAGTPGDRGDGAVVAGGERWKSPPPVDGAPPPAHEVLHPERPPWPNEVGHEVASKKGPPRLLVLNKVDRLADESQLAIWHRRDANAVAVSAITGRGLDQLRARVHDLYQGHMREIEIVVPLSMGRAISFIESRCEVTGRDYDTQSVRYTAKVPDVHLAQLRSMGLPMRDVVGGGRGAGEAPST